MRGQRSARKLALSRMVCLGVTLAGATLALISWIAFDSRRAAQHQAELYAGSVALGIERDLSRTLDILDLSISGAIRGLHVPGIASMDASLQQSIIFGGTAAANEFGGVSITNSFGDIVHSSHPPHSTRISLSDRDYFIRLQKSDDLALFISDPVRSRRDNAWTLELARRVTAPNGIFEGIAVSGLKVKYVQQLFQALNLGPHGSATLFMADGALVARYPFQDYDDHVNVKDSKVFKHILQQRTGTVDGTSLLDGLHRLYSFRQVGSSQIFISVGLAYEDIYAEWVEKTAVVYCIFLILGLLVVYLIRNLVKELGRRTAAEIAARYQAENLAEALARLKAIYDHTKDIMFVAQRQGDRFVYESVNQVFAMFSGRSMEASIGRDPFECWPAEVASIVDAGWSRSIESQRPVYYQYSIDVNGEKRELDVITSPVGGPHGHVTRLVGVGRDITETRRLEAQLRQSQKMEAIGQLTAGIAHDFNNILHVILLNLEMVLEQLDLNILEVECLRQAEKAVKDGASLTHRLLAFSSKQALRPQTLQSGSVVRDIAGLLSRTLGSNFEVLPLIHDDAWAVTADPTQLDSCLLNLALNARDSMLDGGVIRLRIRNETLQLANLAGLPGGDYVSFAVEDEGVGMDAHTVAHALEPFFTTKGAGKGTGLGLSMVLGFAKQSGGDVCIMSVVGQGTTVSLWLPRANENNSPM